MHKILKHDIKLLLLLLTLVALPCILLSSFAIQAIRGQKIIIEQKIEESYTILATNTRKQIIENIYTHVRALDSIFSKNSLWQNSPPVSILNATLQDPIFSSFFLADETLTIIYPQERPRDPGNKEKVHSPEDLIIFEDAYIMEFQKNDFSSAIEKYQKIVIELQEQKLESLGMALLGMARCYLKLQKREEALHVYKNLQVLFKDQQSRTSILFVLDAFCQMADIYSFQKDIVAYYQAYLDMLDTLLYYEFFLTKAQYQYYLQKAQDGLATLPKNNDLSSEDIANLTCMQDNISEKRHRIINQEKELKDIRQYVLMNRKILTIPSGYIEFQVEKQWHLVYYKHIEYSSFKGYVFYKIDLAYCLEKIIIPILQGQELEKDVCLSLTYSDGISIFGETPMPILALVSQPLLPIFSFWHVSIHLRNVQSLEELSQFQSQLYFLGLLAIILALSLGIYVVIITFLREVQNARFRSDFVGNVTHELKTPLTSIKMFVETLLMERAQTEEDKRECLQVISTESDRLSRLIDRILNLAKIQQNRKIFHFVPSNIAELIQNCIDAFSQQILEKSCEITLDIPSDIPEVAIDKESMREAINNVLSNAYKYNDKKFKTISIKVWCGPETKINISIRDNGIGIPHHEFHRVFQKFYRIENDWTKRTAGSGLGLALVESIIQAHRGEIEIQSKIGIGTEFKIQIPISRKSTSR